MFKLPNSMSEENKRNPWKSYQMCHRHLIGLKMDHTNHSTNTPIILVDVKRIKRTFVRHIFFLEERAIPALMDTSAAESVASGLLDCRTSHGILGRETNGLLGAFDTNVCQNLILIDVWNATWIHHYLWAKLHGSALFTVTESLYLKSDCQQICPQETFPA